MGEIRCIRCNRVITSIEGVPTTNILCLRCFLKERHPDIDLSDPEVVAELQKQFAELESTGEE
jgi:hypothetical protein